MGPQQLMERAEPGQQGIHVACLGRPQWRRAPRHARRPQGWFRARLPQHGYAGGAGLDPGALMGPALSGRRHVRRPGAGRPERRRAPRCRHRALRPAGRRLPEHRHLHRARLDTADRLGPARPDRHQPRRARVRRPERRRPRRPHHRRQQRPQPRLREHRRRDRPPVDAAADLGHPSRAVARLDRADNGGPQRRPVARPAAGRQQRDDQRLPQHRHDGRARLDARNNVGSAPDHRLRDAVAGQSRRRPRHGHDGGLAARHSRLRA